MEKASKNKRQINTSYLKFNVTNNLKFDFLLEIKFELFVQTERFAVVRSNSMADDGIAVVAGAVAFVLCPVISRVFVVKVFHKFITVGFSQNGSRCYGHKFAVAFYKTNVRNFGVRFETVAVYQQQGGR
jgi:hypothetical protein